MDILRPGAPAVRESSRRYPNAVSLPANFQDNQIDFSRAQYQTGNSRDGSFDRAYSRLCPTRGDFTASETSFDAKGPSSRLLRSLLAAIAG